MLADRLAQSVQMVARDWDRTHSYYKLAEQRSWLETFWSDDSPFRALFDRLSCDDVLELACGHGRHGAQIVDRCRRLFLMDVTIDNIVACHQRFAGRENVVVLSNGGFDYRPIPDSSLSAIFCYDSMVHFEIDVVGSYLFDTARVLRPGGRALFHHSNFDGNAGGSYNDTGHARNFMTQQLFAHLARRGGLEVVSSVLIPWAGQPDLDALTLVERPVRRRNSSLPNGLIGAVGREIEALSRAVLRPDR